MKKIKLFLAFATCIIAAGQINAQTVLITAHSVVTTPATSCTDTYVANTTQVGCINAVHVGNTFSISGSNIVINNEYTLGPICLGAIAIHQDTINLGNIPAGTYTLTVQGELNSTVVSSQTSTLVVTSCCNASADFTISNDTVCVGDSIHFTNISSGSSGQRWYEGTTMVSSALDYATTFNAPGTYNISVTADGTGCIDSATQTVWVTAYPLVDLGKDTTICASETYLLFAGSGADSVIWSHNATGNLVSITIPGTYWATVYNNGCSASDTMVLGNHPVDNPNLGADTIACDGDTLVLDATLAGASYLWSTSDTTATIEVSSAGTYYVELTNSMGCISTDTIVVAYKNCGASLNENSDLELVIYPNPVKDELRLELPSGDFDALEIYNTLGQLVLKQELSQMEEKVNLTTLPTGTYIVKVSSKETELSTSFIKQ